MNLQFFCNKYNRREVNTLCNKLLKITLTRFTVNSDNEGCTSFTVNALPYL